MSWSVPLFCSFCLLSFLLFAPAVAHEHGWFEFGWRPSCIYVFYSNILTYTGALLLQVHQTNRRLCAILLTIYADVVLVLTFLSFPLHFLVLVIIPVMTALMLGCRFGAATLAAFFQNVALYTELNILVIDYM